MTLKFNTLFNIRAYRILNPLSGKVLGLSSLTHSLQLIFVINTSLSLAQNLNIQIRSQNPMTGIWCHIIENHSQRIWLCPNRTACTPNIQSRRTLHQLWNNICLQLGEFVRCTEKFRYVNGQILNKSSKIILILYNLVKIGAIFIVAITTGQIHNTSLHLRCLVQIQINFSLTLQLCFKLFPISLVHNNNSSDLLHLLQPLLSLFYTNCQNPFFI